MRNPTIAIVKAFKTAIETATGKSVYTRMPKAAKISYPYITISDTYIEELGPKTNYEYRVDMLVNVVYMDANDIQDLHNDVDDIMGIINNDVPFSVDAPFSIQECQLNNFTTIEANSETGVLSIGSIRVMFYVK